MDHLQVRIHGDAALPTLIYLPGLHGDWHLIAPFRAAIAGRARWIEFSYPRETACTLEDHASAVLDVLATHGVSRGAVIGESFGSQVLWAILSKLDSRAESFQPEALILAGGFVRHPFPAMLKLACHGLPKLPLPLIRAAFRIYVAPRRWLSRNCPDVVASFHEFIGRRDTADRAAMTRRLGLTLAHDFRQVAARARWPVFQLSGGFDPFVPPWPVTRWLRAHCPSVRGARIIWLADHNVLGTAPQTSAGQILTWLAMSRPPGVEPVPAENSPER